MSDINALNSDRLLAEGIKQGNDDIIDSDKLSISSVERLEEILKETEEELLSLQPEIDELEAALLKLQALKQTKQKLITLKLSVKSILSNFSNVKSETTLPESLVKTDFTKAKQEAFSTKPVVNKPSSIQSVRPSFERQSDLQARLVRGTFYPNLAFEGADDVLRQKDSTNYELFRAIVFAGGRASTQEIKDYLLEHDVRLPVSGEGFAEVPLTDISARVNYLIRKGLVAPDGRGYFRATVGWVGLEETRSL
ncbi:MAG: hypothetical protein VKJ04_00060 [Vampirovibrionales bacterium]|nr:hypothetical protein [Vampirovibrionales bacterium]